MGILQKFGGQVWYQAGQGVGIATLTGNRTLNGTSAHFQSLSPSGADRNLVLPALGVNGHGQWYIVRNTGATYNLVVKKSDGSTTVATVPPGSWTFIVAGKVSGSLDWYVMGGDVGFTSLTLLGTLTAVAGVFTGQVTTTDGVTSGNARIVGGNVHTKIAATTLTNTTTETTLATHTLPANTLKAGTTVRVRGAVRVTGNAAADTLLFKLRLGGTAIVTTTASAMVANDIARFDFLITSRAAASAASEVAAEGGVTISVAGTQGVKGYVYTPTNYATNGALAVDLRGTWSAASASDIAICESFVVDVVA